MYHARGVEDTGKRLFILLVKLVDAVLQLKLLVSYSLKKSGIL
jgi:hypothetical protein